MTPVNARLVAVDIGGTHARFAMATIAAGAVTLGDVITLKTAEHASFETAWAHFAEISGTVPPRAAAIAVAGPVNTSVSAGVFRFTNNPWVIDRDRLNDRLAIDRHVVVNDFEAVGHAVAKASDDDFIDLAGPATPLPATGMISVIGPGTGLGVAHVWRAPGQYRVTPTEGGHTDFAPVDTIDDAMLARLRKRYVRVSVERIVSGPGLIDIYETLGAIEGRAIMPCDDKALWQRALGGRDDLATAALDRFCLSLGSVAGDLALAHGANAVVIAGGLGLRLKDRIAASGFADRFCGKGRFQSMMAQLPVKLIVHPQPGLFGAAVAFASASASL